MAASPALALTQLDDPCSGWAAAHARPRLPRRGHPGMPPLPPELPFQSPRGRSRDSLFFPGDAVQTTFANACCFPVRGLSSFQPNACVRLWAVSGSRRRDAPSGEQTPVQRPPRARDWARRANHPVSEAPVSTRPGDSTLSLRSRSSRGRCCCRQNSSAILCPTRQH